MVADALSHLPAECMVEADVDDDIPELYVEFISTMAAEIADKDDTTNNLSINIVLKPSIANILCGQKRDSFCQGLIKGADEYGSPYFLVEHRLLSKRFRLDGATPHALPATFRPVILCHAHNPVLVGHPGERRMYDTMRPLFYRPHMAKDVHAYVEACPDCRKHGRHPTHQRLLKLISPDGPFEFVAMVIFGPPPKTKNDNLFIVVITDRFKKLTMAIPSNKTTATHIVQTFFGRMGDAIRYP